MLVFFATGIAVNDIRPKRQGARVCAVAGRFDDHAKFGLKTGQMIEGEIGALQADIADGGLFFELGTVFGLAADGGGKMKAAALAEAMFAHVNVDAAFAEIDGHGFSGGPRGREFLAGRGKEAVDYFV